MGYVVFNGVSSASLGLVIQTPPEETYPSKDVETIHITGRNGDIILDKDSYKNGTRVYNFAIGFPELDCIEVRGIVYVKNSETYSGPPYYGWTCNDPNLDTATYEKTVRTMSRRPTVNDITYREEGYGSEYWPVLSESWTIGAFNFYTRIFTKWVHSAKGYANLEDSYAPDIYRRAIYYDSGSYVNAYDQATAFEVAFGCKPQKFLKAYAEPINIPWSQVQGQWYKVYNPTDQIAKLTIGPSAEIPQTTHYPYIYVNGDASHQELNNAKYFRYEQGDTRAYYAWINKTYDGVEKYKIVYTVLAAPEAQQSIKYKPEASSSYICGTVTSYHSTLTTYQIKIGRRSGDDFESDDHWVIDINNDYETCNRLTISSEYMECYYEDPDTGEITLKNQYVSISGTEGFPVLFPGDNYIWYDNTSGAPSGNIIPLTTNYWCL